MWQFIKNIFKGKFREHPSERPLPSELIDFKITNDKTLKEFDQDVLNFIDNNLV